LDDIYVAGVTPTIAEWESTQHVINEDDFTTSFYQTTVLKGGVTYYWRVIAYYDDGLTAGSYDSQDRVIKRSDVSTFTTKGGAVQAVPSWPVGDPTIYTLQPTLHWYLLEQQAGVTFQVLYSLNNDVDAGTGALNNFVTTVSAGTNFYYTFISDLDADEEYYWQVKTTYAATSTETYSAVAKFTTDAIGIYEAYQPILSYPIDAVDVYTTAPMFSWYFENAYTHLSFNLYYKVVSAGTWEEELALTDLYFQTSGLTPGATYEWYVKSFVTNAPATISTPSTTETFTVLGGSLSSAVATWPLDNPTVYSKNPSVNWLVEGSTTGWTGYKVKWYEGASAPADWQAVSDVEIITNINTKNLEIHADLNYGSKYYWAVALYDGANDPIDAAYSEGSFTVVGGSTVTLVPTSPEDGALLFGTTQTVNWYVSGPSTGINKFQVTYSYTSNFNPTYTSSVASTTASKELTGLIPGNTYYWYVEFSYDNGVPWHANVSTTFSFSIDAGSNAVQPLVASPTNGVTINKAEPTLSWRLPSASTSILSYDVQIADNPDFVNASEINDLSKLRASVTNLKNGEYFWRVRSKVSGTSNATIYSSTGHFKVDGISDVEENGGIANDYHVFQNYPNPFNPSTAIKYRLPQAGIVSIKIYDMLGQEVKSLFNAEQESGTFTIVWLGDDNKGNTVTSGTYLIKVTSGDFTQVKKMLFLK
ncbi:MAG: T9SS type A sorting domain-containing protein, partial [Proteobacteria bacterium]|nr:T9SS type A sorting domain-containing protein [Pseudomonadota bacterium]